MKKFIRNNSLTIAFLLLFFLSLCFQIGAGFKVHNEELQQDGAAPVPFSQYLTSGHLISSTFENWESEFLQMALFVILTIFLFQKGSSESKDPDSKEQEEVDKEPDPNKKDAPWPVKRGGVWLSLYKHSLTISLLLLFLLSFAIHFYGSLKDENEELLLKHEPPETAASYFTNARFWFESMQNWQSEFLSVFAIVMLSVYLRQKGSPQSKPVDAPHMETGG
jgi:hypothetical protein